VKKNQVLCAALLLCASSASWAMNPYENLDIEDFSQEGNLKLSELSSLGTQIDNGFGRLTRCCEEIGACEQKNQQRETLLKHFGKIKMGLEGSIEKYKEGNKALLDSEAIEQEDKERISKLVENAVGWKKQLEFIEKMAFGK